MKNNQSLVQFKTSLFATLAVLFTLLASSCSSTENRDMDASEIEASNPENPNKGPKGQFQFVDSVFNFGQINDGEVVEHTFRFKNVGKGPLSIVKVEASCGCTTPKWTKEVIPPGGEGSITATFDSNGKGGPDNPLVEKSISVDFDNTDRGFIVLIFKANILAKSTEDAQHNGH